MRRRTGAEKADGHICENAEKLKSQSNTEERKEYRPRFQHRASQGGPTQNIVRISLCGQSLHVASIVDFKLSDIYFQFVQIIIFQLILCLQRATSIEIIL